MAIGRNRRGGTDAKRIRGRFQHGHGCTDTEYHPEHVDVQNGADGGRVLRLKHAAGGYPRVVEKNIESTPSCLADSLHSRLHI